jgi:hypothetical protein
VLELRHPATAPSICSTRIPPGPEVSIGSARAT